MTVTKAPVRQENFLVDAIDAAAATEFAKAVASARGQTVVTVAKVRRDEVQQAFVVTLAIR